MSEIEDFMITIKDKDYDIKYRKEYERKIGNPIHPDYIDIKIGLYLNDYSYISLYFWIDINNNTIEINSGYYHNEPLPKEIIDIIIDEFNLNVYTIKNKHMYE